MTAVVAVGKTARVRDEMNAPEFVDITETFRTELELERDVAVNLSVATLEVDVELHNVGVVKIAWSGFNVEDVPEAKRASQIL